MIAALLGVLGVAAIAVGLLGSRGAQAEVAADDAQSTVPTLTATPTPTPTQPVSGVVEVPDVTGMARSEAEVILVAAGLTTNASSEVAADDRISSQDPAPRILVDAGSPVLLEFESADNSAKESPSPAIASSPAAAPKTRSTGWVVCIDPGHQEKGDSTPEPIGPKSKKTKPSVTGGATGVKTGVPEYEIVLQISTNLKRQLEERGIKVVMTRTTNDVNLSNSRRAEIANDAEADLFVRIHCDGSPDRDVAGVSTLYPASNTWTKSFAPESKRAATSVQSAVIASTGAVDRGTKARTDLSGFNWAKVPSVLVECGFLSNPVEDRLLASPHYQDKLAAGIAEGIVSHLEAQRP